MNKHLFLMMICAIILLGGPGRALAHKVNLYAYAEDGKLIGEGYFSGGRKAQKAVVKLLGPDGKELGQTKTDTKGAFTIPFPPGVAPLKLVLIAGEGHKGEFALTAQDLGVDEKKAQPPTVDAPELEAPAQGIKVDLAALENQMSRLLDRKLAPIQAQLGRLAREGDQVTLKDVVGGLGWILGLVGLAAFFMSRRRS